jgi:translation initiation factor 3 subunit I
MRPYVIHVHERPLTLVKFNYDGDFFITCAKDGDVCLIRTETVERVGTYQPVPPRSTPPGVSAVDITIDSKWVVTSNFDGELTFYTFGGQHICKLDAGGVIKYVEFNQKPFDQNRVCTCNDKLGTTKARIMVWSFVPQTKDRPKMERILCIDEAMGLKLPATKVKWGPLDETLVSINSEGSVIIWDSRDGSEIKTIEAHATQVTGMNFSDDRLLMVTTSKDQTCKLWAMDEYECVKTYKTDRPLNDAAISPLYTAEKEPKFHIIMGGGQEARDAALTGAKEGKFETMLWHMVYEEEIGSIKGGFGPMNTIAWFRNGAGFVTGGEDGFVRVHHFDSDYFTNKKFE